MQRVAQQFARVITTLAACTIAACSGPDRADAADSGIDGGAMALDASPDGPGFRGHSVGAVDMTLEDFDAIGYDLDLVVDDATPAQETFRARMLGTFVATRPIHQLTLDFVGNDIDSVEIDGRVTTSTRDGTHVVIALPEMLEAGRLFSATIRYHGSFLQGDTISGNDFVAYGGLIVRQRNRAGHRIFLSLGWPSRGRRWMPLRDHPRDGAMFALRATFPAAFTVIGNGRRESMADNADGTRTWQYASYTPMPTYDFHIAAYEDWVDTAAAPAGSGIEIHQLAYSRDTTNAALIYADITACMDFYERTFGPFRWEQLSFLEEPIFGGGMEHATVVSMDDSLYRGSATSRLTAFHELAHHWSGNLVRIGTWNDFWLSEGFTEYEMRRFVLDHDGPDAAKRLWRQTLNDAMGTEVNLASRTMLHALRPADPEVDVLAIFDAISYKKGAWVVRMLEHELGTERLTTFLHGWFDQHRGGHVVTADLQRELEAVAGRSLAPFFSQWVHGSYHPVLQVRWSYDAVMRTVQVTVVQQQAHGPAGGFAMPLELEFSAGAERLRAIVPVSGMTSTATIAATFAPTAVTIDPDEWLFALVTCDAKHPCQPTYTCGLIPADALSVCIPDTR